MLRRSFLKAMAALPVVGKLVKAEEPPVMPAQCLTSDKITSVADWIERRPDMQAAYQRMVPLMLEDMKQQADEIMLGEPSVVETADSFIIRGPGTFEFRVGDWQAVKEGVDETA